MAEMLIYDRDKGEVKILEDCARRTVAYQSDDRLFIREFPGKEKVEAYLEEGNLLDLAIMEISGERDIRMAEQVRGKGELLDMMLIADSGISPMKYMTPKIRACSLLLRPYEKMEAAEVVQEFVSEFYRKQRDADEERALLIENREGKTAVPYSQIYYLEVREKRIYIRLRDREYSKYDTLENIIKTLPENFLRCHRSFVFNVSYFQRVKLSENLIYLEHGIQVPLSRTYKTDIKEYLNGLRDI